MTTTQKQGQIVLIGGKKNLLVGSIEIKRRQGLVVLLIRASKWVEERRRNFEKNDKGNTDSDWTIETKTEMPKKKMNLNLKRDLIIKKDGYKKLNEQMDVQHNYKLDQINRMFDLFEGSLSKRLSRILSTLY